MQIISGRREKPFNVLVYSHQGAGKTTWASHSPSPIFICGDELDEMDVARFPRLQKFSDVIDQLNYLINNKTDYETVVLDSIDVVEALAHQDILSQEKSSKTKSMNKAGGGYGAAYDTSLRMMTEVKDLLARLRDEKEMNIIIICHSVGKTINDPILGDSYMEYSLTVHEKVRNLFTSWVSAVLFMTIEMTKDSDDKFAFSSGNRIIYTQKVAGIHDVKNRYNLDPILSAPEENPFKSFYDGFKMYFKTTKGNDEAKRIEMLITELLPNVKDDVMVGKIKSSMEKNRGSVENLIKVKTKVEQLIGV